MATFTVVSFVALSLAALHSLRARFLAGTACAALSALVVIAAAVAILDPTSVAGWLLDPLWLTPLLLTALAVPVATYAFRQESSESELSPRHVHLGRAAMAWLAVALLDIAVLGIVFVATQMASEPF